MPEINEIVHRLPRDPVHLYQLNNRPGAYYNEKGCGAFSTAMAMSCYEPGRFGTYAAARWIFDKMLKVPFLGGTFEGENAVMGRRHHYLTNAYDHGTLTDLSAAIDVGAPTIMLVNPGPFGIGRHDVLLVGFSVDPLGGYLKLFVDNPAIEKSLLESPPGLSYPGNESYPVSILSEKWTGCFTPFFQSQSAFDKWRARTGRT